MVPPLISLEGWILQDSFQMAVHWPLEAWCLYPFVTPCAVSLGDLSVLGCGHWRCRDNVLPDWDTSLFFTAATSGEPRAQGREHSQGWAERGAVHECASCPGMLPQCCLWNGTQPQPPAPLRDAGDYEGLFSDAGSGSDRSILSDVGPREFPSLQWNKTTEAALFHFPSGWPPQRGHPAHQLWETLWLPRCGSTTGFCCLPLCGIARVSSPRRFPVAAMLGLHSAAGMRQNRPPAAPQWEKHCPGIRITQSCAFGLLRHCCSLLSSSSPGL